MENNFECMTIISHMFDEWCKKAPFHELILRDRAGEMMLLVPRPFMYVLMNEIRELSSVMPRFQTSFMFAKTSFPYPIHVTRNDENGEPLLRINGVLVLAAFDMSLHLYHVEATERLDGLLVVSVPLMPGMNVDDRIPGVGAVIFKIEKSLPSSGFDIERAKLMN